MKVTAAMNLARYTPIEFIYNARENIYSTIQNNGKYFVLRHYRIFEEKSDIHLYWLKEYGVVLYTEHKSFY